MKKCAITLGVGVVDGIGGAISKRFAAEGLHVFVTGRTHAKIAETAQAIREAGGSAEAMQVDVTNSADQDDLFATASAYGEIAAVLFNAGNNAPIPFEELSEEMFESFWRTGCFGAFLTAKRALPLLKAQGQGSLIFTGASASLRGRPMFGHFASAKAALRNLVQALSREYGPQGIHIAHVVIDGVVNGDNVRGRFGDYLEQLGEEGSLAPSAVAEAFWNLHVQDRTAWTQELDLRPYNEKW